MEKKWCSILKVGTLPCSLANAYSRIQCEGTDMAGAYQTRRAKSNSIDLTYDVLLYCNKLYANGKEAK
jgi:hypothetical protein